MLGPWTLAQATKLIPLVHESVIFRSEFHSTFQDFFLMDAYKKLASYFAFHKREIDFTLFKNTPDCEGDGAVGARPARSITEP